MTLNQALISATTLNSSVSSVTIPVPSGYTDLRLVFSARNDTSPSIWYEHVRLTFNGGGGNYTSKMLYGNGSGAYGADDSGGSSTYAPWAGVFCAGNSTANTFSNCEIYIPNYSVSGVAKNFSGESVSEGMVGGGVTGATAQAMLWTGTAAITSITLTAAVGNFVAGTEFTLYGITKLGVTPTQTPKASGGDIVKNDGTYWYHAFFSSGQFIPQTGLSCDYVVVGGGGSGGGSWGGGGGAGGYRAGSGLSVTAQPYTITVGAGGVGSVDTGKNGGSSTFSTITSAGGGGGGYYFGNGLAGGSGGGGAGGYAGLANHGQGGAGNTPSVSPSQGNNGGEGYSPPDYAGNRYGGGGGGSASVGASANSGSGGAGGSGTSYSLAGTSTTYAAGGNGNALGGGAGAANTGNGGAGGGESVAGSNGGSGIVIIRYAMA